MEELLNKLIQKWWKPRWENVELHWASEDTFWEKIVIFNGNAGWFKRWWCTYRELVSKESWLRQFCCENELIKGNTREAYYWQYKTPLWAAWSYTYRKEHYQHRLIESALKDESELEQFLLDNIMIK